MQLKAKGLAFCLLLTVPATVPASGDLLRQLDEEIVRLVREVSPSVVTVIAEASGKGGVQRRIGSAVVLDDSGHVVTTASVVETAERITLKTSDGRAFSARLVGTDMLSNLAVLEAPTPPEGLVPASRGSHTRLAAGSWVAMIANSYGVPYGVTVGAVVDPGPSPCGLSEVGEIRLNLRATPGASGGAVVNCAGEMVGILTAAMGPGSSEYDVDADYFGGRLYGFVPQQDLGMSLAVPMESVCRVADRLIAGGEVARGWLGVRIEEGAAQSRIRGVTIQSVLPDGPAERAELLQGDVIVSFDGQKTASCSELKQLVAAATEGATVRLGVLRGGQVIEVTLELGAVPDEMVRSLRAAGATSIEEPVGQVRWWWRNPRDGAELRRQIEDLEAMLKTLKAEVSRLERKK
jgi:S1-C subfamily serine protease